MNFPQYFHESGILTPTLEFVGHVNNFVISLITVDEKKYYSSDSVCQLDKSHDVVM